MKSKRLLVLSAICGVMLMEHSCCFISVSEAGSVKLFRPYQPNDSHNTNTAICPNCNQPTCEWKSKTYVPVTVWGPWEKRCYEWRDECGRLIKKEVWVRCHRDEYRVIEEQSPPLRGCPPIKSTPLPCPPDSVLEKQSYIPQHRTHPSLGVGAHIQTPILGVGAGVQINSPLLRSHHSYYHDLPVY